MPRELKPKASSRNPQQLQDRLKMYDNGYLGVIPCESKSGMLRNWTTVQITPKQIRDWDSYKKASDGTSLGSGLLGTGMRLFGDMLIIDLDIKDPDIMNAVLDMLIAHPVYGKWVRMTLWRNSGGVSLALIGRCSEAIRSKPHKLFVLRDADGKIIGKAHCEVHGGLAKRYFAFYGPHSESPRQYGFEGPSPLDTLFADLAVLPVEMVGPMLDAIEAVLAEHMEVLSVHEDKGGASLYDLEPETVFVIKHGEELTVTELEARLGVGIYGGEYGVLKSEEAESDSGTRHHAFLRERNGRLVITDHYRSINHYPADEAPPQPDMAELAALLRETTEEEVQDDTPDDDGDDGDDGEVERGNTGRLRHSDLIGHMPSGKLIYRPTSTLWVTTSVDKRLGKVTLKAEDDKGKPIKMASSTYIMKTNAVDQMSWLPGQPEIIADQVMLLEGLSRKKGARLYNMYRAPVHGDGNPAKAQRWIDHVYLVYPTGAARIIRFMAHATQRPGVKINHGLLLGGAPGIGKDTILAPLRYAVGGSNFAEVRPPDLFDAFNTWQQAVVLRINELHDLGEHNMYALYERMKPVTAAPPEALPINEKHIGRYYIPNIVKVIMTTNYKENGIYLPPDDRRTDVMWSPLTHDQRGSAEYFNGLYAWLEQEGNGHVAAYLMAYDLTGFDPKAPPAKTDAFWAIVNANRSPTDSNIGDIVEGLTKQHDGTPPMILTVETMRDYARSAGMFEASQWLGDIKHRRQIPASLERAGYVEVANPDATDRRWTIGGTKQSVYQHREVALRDAMAKIAERIDAAHKARENAKPRKR